MYDITCGKLATCNARLAA